MPIDIRKSNGITYRHVAERFQINNLLAANEQVINMRCEAYFVTSLYLGEEKLTETWDNQPLVFDCTDDPELEAAMKVIQNRIGVKRYQQITEQKTETLSSEINNPTINTEDSQ